MPRIDYAALITESVEELRAAEHRLRGQPTQPRVRMLRFLKEGQLSSLRAGASVLGYSLSQLYRWWHTYQQDGLDRLLTVAPRPHRRARLTAEAWAGLEAEMTAGQVTTLKDAQRYLAETWHITYSLNGVWYQLHQRRARKKTGRRRHRKASSQAQADYKRRLRRHPQRAPLHERLGLR